MEETRRNIDIDLRQGLLPLAVEGRKHLNTLAVAVASERNVVQITGMSDSFLLRIWSLFLFLTLLLVLLFVGIVIIMIVLTAF